MLIGFARFQIAYAAAAVVLKLYISLIIRPIKMILAVIIYMCGKCLTCMNLSFDLFKGHMIKNNFFPCVSFSPYFLRWPQQDQQNLTHAFLISTFWYQLNFRSIGP